MMKTIDGGQQLIQGGKQLTQRTRGIEVHSLKSSEGLRWSIWDMGGQEEFHGFHYFMLPDLSDNFLQTKGDRGLDSFRRS